MKYQIAYELVIPVYNDFDNLNILLGQLAETNIGYTPGRILIVNDGSTDDRIAYADGLLGSRSLAPVQVISTSHMGPYMAETIGLNEVKSPYAVVLHSDTQLAGEIPLPLIKDPVSVLACYLYQTQDAVAVSCFGLNSGVYDRIEKGPRGIRKDVPQTLSRNLFFYSVYQSKILAWQRILSTDSHCYALNMEMYHKLGGFHQQFAPYGFYHDDFFARARQDFRKHVYCTTDTVVYHPVQSAKTNGSLANIVHSDRFQERWKDSPIWSENSIRENARTLEVF